MKIRTKLLGGFLLVVAFLLVGHLLAYIGLTRVAGEVGAVSEEAAEAIKAFEIQSAIADTMRPVRRYVDSGDPAEKETFTNLVAVVEDRIAEMQAMKLEGKESALEHLAEGWVELRDELTAIMDIRNPAGTNSEQAATRLRKAEGLADWVHGYSYTFVVTTQQRLLRTRQEAEATVRSTLLLLAVVAVLALAAALAVGLTVSRSITHAVSVLAQAAERISLGELDVAVVLKSKDELGDLAHSFERMRVSLKAAMERLRRQ